MTRPYIQIFAGTSTKFAPTRLEVSSPVMPNKDNNAVSANSFFEENVGENAFNDEIESNGFLHVVQDLSDAEGDYQEFLPPTKHNEYDYFETLSLVHAAINQELEDSLNPLLTPIKAKLPDEPARLTKFKQGASFVNGVDIPGSFVGEHIVNNLFGIFDAIARGCDDIILLGHSRGAIAAILAAHELNALKTGGNNLLDILRKTPCPYTKRALANLTQNQIDWLNANSTLILNSIRGLADHKAVSFSLFGIDPVPGVGYSITWKDERYFKIPPIVSEAEIIIMQHERTGAFRPILPKALDPQNTKLKTTLLPGNHATAEGNLLNQTRDHKDEIRTRRHVQKLTLAKITRMLMAHGVEFKKRFSDKFKLSNAKMLNLYRKIQKYFSLYAELRHHGYPHLPLESIENSRAVCTNNIYYPIALDAYIPPVYPYINSEHLILELESLFKLKDELNPNPAAILNAISAKITPQFANTITSLSAAKTPESPAQFTTMIQSLINIISAAYLKNNMNQDEKLDLILAITNFLQKLASLSNIPLIQTTFDQVKNGIKKTIEVRIATLQEIYNDFITKFYPINDPSLAHQLNTSRESLLNQCNELVEGLTIFNQQLLNLTLGFSLKEMLQVSINLKKDIQLLRPLCINQETVVSPRITTSATTQSSSPNVKTSTTQTVSFEDVIKNLPLDLRNKMGYNAPFIYCQNAIKQLKKACNTYLNHIESKERTHHAKIKAVNDILRIINNNKSSQDKGFIKLREFLLLPGNKTIQILSKNLQSICEFTLKILAVLSGLFAIILAVKRLYDSRGKSINFFKPLAQTCVVEEIDNHFHLGYSFLPPKT